MKSCIYGKAVFIFKIFNCRISFNVFFPYLRLILSNAVFNPRSGSTGRVRTRWLCIFVSVAADILSRYFVYVPARQNWARVRWKYHRWLWNFRQQQRDDCWRRWIHQNSHHQRFADNACLLIRDFPIFAPFMCRRSFRHAPTDELRIIVRYIHSSSWSVISRWEDINSRFVFQKWKHRCLHLQAAITFTRTKLLLSALAVGRLRVANERYRLTSVFTFTWIERSVTPGAVISQQKGLQILSPLPESVIEADQIQMTLCFPSMYVR